LELLRFLTGIGSVGRVFRVLFAGWLVVYVWMDDPPLCFFIRAELGTYCRCCATFAVFVEMDC